MLAAADALEIAFIKANSGTRNATQVMYGKRAALNNLLAKLGNYVEDTANKTTVQGEVITSAGMKYKRVHIRKPRVFAVKNDKMKGTVIATAKSAKGRASFVWQYRLLNSAEWLTAAITVKASYVFTGLLSGNFYEFRQQTVTKNGTGDFTDKLQLVVL